MFGPVSGGLRGEVGGAVEPSAVRGSYWECLKAQFAMTGEGLTNGGCNGYDSRLSRKRDATIKKHIAV